MRRIRARVVLPLFLGGLAVVQGGCSSATSPTLGSVESQAQRQEAIAQNQPRGLSPQADPIARGAMAQANEPSILAGIPDPE